MRAWNDLTEEEQEVIRRKTRTCQCCGVEQDSPFNMDMRWLRGVRKARACGKCADEYFESIKAQYFVEEYKGNKFYKDGDKYFPYWEAPYFYLSIEDCRTRANMKGVAAVDLNAYHMVNNLLK